jgi:hypothetical protein
MQTSSVQEKLEHAMQQVKELQRKKKGLVGRPDAVRRQHEGAECLVLGD